MPKSDKNYLMIVVVYTILLLISLLVFLKEPNWRVGGIGWNGLFLVLGSTLGAVLFMGYTTVQMVGKKISLVCGIGSISCLAAVSLICLILIAPMIASV